MEHIGTAERVAARISEQIRESGVTLTWLCVKTGIPKSTMLRRLNGHSPFNLNELDRLADALRMSTRDLLGGAA